MRFLKKLGLIIATLLLTLSLGLGLYHLKINKEGAYHQADIIEEENRKEEGRQTDMLEEKLPDKWTGGGQLRKVAEEEEEVLVTFAHGGLTEDKIDRIRGLSYRENDKIGIEDLAYLEVAYWGFDDKTHRGELIVNSVVAEDVVEIFRELYEAKFPIEKIRLIDEYGADDNLSMADNNSSAFCYREITGSKGKLSKHGYGIAIDINPIQNPYIKNNIILPGEGGEYLDREDLRKGMIIKGDACYKAFTSRGWTWGGEWKSLKDYQHFEYKLDGDG